MRVLELFSGIGGMHYACKEAGLTVEHITAIDVNTNANSVYKHNFPEASMSCRNIQSLTSLEINKLAPDIILMSPPCQPFTRVGLKKDVSDQRSSALVHITNLIPELSQRTRYILLENVKGFEVSEARCQLLEVLQQEKFTVQEFLLSPVQFSIPNSRLRYYMLAKRLPLKFCFQAEPLLFQEFPVSFDHGRTTSNILLKLNSKYRNLALEDTVVPCEEKNEPGSCLPCFTISHVLDSEELLKEALDELLLPEKVLGKRSVVLDIVNPQSKRSCCFTKAYGRYSDGTGSVITSWNMTDVNNLRMRNRNFELDSEVQINEMKLLKLRYFSPREVSHLMCFPEHFSFPSEITTKQKYKLLGNSVNVHVIALLISLLLACDDEVLVNV